MCVCVCVCSLLSLRTEVSGLHQLCGAVLVICNGSLCLHGAIELSTHILLCGLRVCMCVCGPRDECQAMTWNCDLGPQAVAGGRERLSVEDSGPRSRHRVCPAVTPMSQGGCRAPEAQAWSPAWNHCAAEPHTPVAFSCHVLPFSMAVVVLCVSALCPPHGQLQCWLFCLVLSPGHWVHGCQRRRISASPWLSDGPAPTCASPLRHPHGPQLVFPGCPGLPSIT